MRTQIPWEISHQKGPRLKPSQRKPPLQQPEGCCSLRVPEFAAQIQFLTQTLLRLARFPRRLKLVARQPLNWLGAFAGQPASTNPNRASLALPRKSQSA